MRVRVNALPAGMLLACFLAISPVSESAARTLRPSGPVGREQAPLSGLQSYGRVLPSVARAWQVSTTPAEEPRVGEYRAPVLPSYRPRLGASGGASASLSPAARPARTCVVTSTNDSGPGTLRDCLLNAVSGDTITFNPAVFPPSAPQTIRVDSELPPIAVDNLTIDGSHAGVILDGNRLTGSTAGLAVFGHSGVIIRGLQIRRFGWGIVLLLGASNCTIGGSRSIGSSPLGQGNLISGNEEVGIGLQDASTTGNTIIGNFIGTNLAGDAADGNEVGILVATGAAGNVIGGRHTPGLCDGPCNLISGNLSDGIKLQEDGTDDNRILGNFIGTDLSGARAIANNHGVEIVGGASANRIGSSASGEGNLISGNSNLGVWISWEETAGNSILGNHIGTDAAGEAALPNHRGVLVNGSTANHIGGAEPGASNLIGGNEYAGIVLEHLNAPGNVVAGNRIGTNAGGTVALPNSYYGILLSHASSNLIGGAEPGAGNLISGNAASGVAVVSNSSSNSMLGNLVGTDLAGEMAIPNGTDGVAISYGSSGNQVGGSAPGAGNLISGNGAIGVRIEYDSAVDNHVAGNRIGTNRAGTAALPNGADGILIIGAPGTVVGGAHTPWVCSGACNLISGNGGSGVVVQGVSASAAYGSALRDRGPDATLVALPSQNVQVLGNFIGTDLAGTHAVPNVNGVNLLLQATGNRIGSGIPGEGNLVSGNTEMGIVIHTPDTTENLVLGNRIGTTATGDSALPNGIAGIFITDGAHGNGVGGEGAGEGNVISGHTTTGHDFAIRIQNAPAPGVTGNRVIGNLIGTDWSGTRAIPNSGGVLLIAGPTETLIRRNVISGNVRYGIEVDDAGTRSNTLADNLIGIAADGQTPLPNLLGMIFFGADRNTVGPANTIAHNKDFGVVLYGPGTVGNTISQSLVYGNELGQIAFLQVPEPPVRAPVLTTWDGLAVSGTACAGCVVEVFSSRTHWEGGRTYLGAATADAGGAFMLTVGSGHAYLTATATDSEGTTSGFAESLFIGHAVYLPVMLGVRPAAPTPTATRTPKRTATPRPTSTRTPTTTPTGTPLAQPKAGFWQDATGETEFYVTADRVHVDEFAILVWVPGCGGYKITYHPLVPITSRAFSFSGQFHANGTFASATVCSGTSGLDGFAIAGCGMVDGGPWSYSTTWRHATGMLVSSGASTISVEPVPWSAGDDFLPAQRAFR